MAILFFPIVFLFKLVLQKEVASWPLIYWFQFIPLKNRNLTAAKPAKYKIYIYILSNLEIIQYWKYALRLSTISIELNKKFKSWCVDLNLFVARLKFINMDWAKFQTNRLIYTLREWIEFCIAYNITSAL